MSFPASDRPSTAAGSDQPAVRPATSSGRPKTRSRPTKTARLDTGVSDIGDGPLPDQEFFREGDDFSEEGEYSEDEEEEDGVFAFERPITAAVPGGTFTSGDETSDVERLNTGNSGTSYGLPTTAGTHATGLRSVPESIAPTGNVDAGGHLPELSYNVRDPPIYSGRNNLNNSAFAFSINSGRSRQSSQDPSVMTSSRPPTTGQSLMAKIARRRLDTGTTDMTGTTDASRTTHMSSAYSRRSSMETGDGESLGGDGEHPKARRMRSSAPLIPGTSSGISTDSYADSRRGQSRGSYGMTELTGDITVPDGMTTWGDGLGGLMKKGNSEAGSQVAFDIDMLDEDSPYPEVRASVSNLDDPEMPGTYSEWP